MSRKGSKKEAWVVLTPPLPVSLLPSTLPQTPQFLDHDVKSNIKANTEYSYNLDFFIFSIFLAYVAYIFFSSYLGLVRGQPIQRTAYSEDSLFRGQPIQRTAN
jgi:hypothetical protein